MYCKMFGGGCTLRKCGLYQACVQDGNILPVHPLEVEIPEVYGNEGALIAVCRVCGLTEPFIGYLGLDNPKVGDKVWGCGECGAIMVLRDEKGL